MFGLQAGWLKNFLRGVNPELEGLADTLGDCEAELEHSGPIRFGGPLTFGDTVSNPDGVLLVDPERGAELFGGYTFDEFMAGLAGTPGAKKGTLAGDLARDGTATLNIAGGGTITVGGYFVKTSYKISSGQRVGAISFDGGVTWDVIVNDDCLVPA